MVSLNIKLFVLFALLICSSVIAVDNWTMDGNGGVYWTNGNGTISVFPAISNDLITHVQYLNTSYNGTTGWVNMSFVFPNTVTNFHIYAYYYTTWNISVPTVVRGNYSYTFPTNQTNYSASNFSCDMGDSQNTLKYKITYNYNGTVSNLTYCFNSYNGSTIYYQANDTQYIQQQTGGFTYNDVTNGTVTTTQYGNYTIYSFTNVYFPNNVFYKDMISYDTPIGSSGKYSIYAHSGSALNMMLGIGKVFLELDPWWNSSYGFKQNFNYTPSIASNLIGFPKYVNISTQTLITVGKLVTNCTNLRFVNATENTVLNYEIASGCNGTNTQFWVNDYWNNFTENKYIYYNSTDYSNASSSSTWDSNYAGVWHLEGSMNDSTINRMNGTSGGTFTWNASSKIGTGYQGSSTNGWIGVPAYTGFGNTTDSFTLSFWAVFVNTSSQTTPVVKRDDATHLAVYLKLFTNGSIGWVYYENTQPEVDSVSTFFNGSAWHHVALVRDKAHSLLLLYIDGVNERNATDTTTTSVSSSYPLCIGKDSTKGCNSGFGNDIITNNVQIDEIHISNTVRSSDWIKQEASLSPVTFGIEQVTQTNLYVTLNQPSNNNITTNTTLNFNWTTTGDWTNYLSNLTISNGGTVIYSNISSPNGSAVNYSVSGLTEGKHNWTVTSWNTTSNVSVTNNFTVYTTAPNITLISPQNNSISINTTWLFNFRVLDDLDSNVSCSLIIDGIVNQTNATVLNNTNTTFTVTNLSISNHTWKITCSNLAITNSSNIYAFIITAPYFVSPTPSNNTNDYSFPMIINITTLSNESITSGNISSDNGVTNNSCVLNPDNKSCSYTLNYADMIFNHTYVFVGVMTINGNNILVNETRTVPYYGCGYVNGNVTILNNINISGNDCLTVNASNIVINGNGYTISGDSDNGIYDIGDSNININDLFISNFSNGIELFGCSNFSIHNNSITGGYYFSGFGIITDTTTNISIYNNTITNNEYGVYLDTDNGMIYNNIFNSNSEENVRFMSSTGNIIYNNIFNTTTSGSVYDDGTNSWNMPKTLGTNIIGGNYTGGNYYFDYTGKTYDGSGIGHTSYLISGGSNIDYFPLTNVVGNTSIPVVTLNSPVNGISINTSQAFNFTATDTVDLTLYCSLVIDNVINQTNSSISNNTPTVFLVSGLLLTNHSWYVNCSNSFLNVGNSTINNILIYSIPTVTLNNPANNNISTNINEQLNWTTNGGYSNYLSNLTLDGSVYSSNILTLNNTMENVSIVGISEGVHYWNVSSWNVTNGIGISSTYKFTVYHNAPTVTLVSPANLYTTNITTVVTTFSAIDNIDSSFSCSLILDGSISQTNSSTLNNTVTSFTSLGVSVGNHTWSVNCTNNGSLTGSSVQRIFIITGIPTLTAVSITPAPAYKSSTLATSSTYNSGNGYNGTVTFTWYVNNVAVYIDNEHVNTGITAVTSLSNLYFNKGYLVNVTAIAYDGYSYSLMYGDSIVILNSAPTLSAPVILPSIAYSNTSFTSSTVYNDIDGDIGNVTFRWYVSGNNTLNTSSLVSAGGTATTLLPDLPVGSIISLSVIAYDGFSYSTVTYSIGNVTILNSPPDVTIPILSVNTSDVYGSSLWTDLNNDTMNGLYWWYVNSVVVDNGSRTNVSNGTTENFNLSILTLNTGDSVYLQLRVTDGIDNTTVVSNTYTVGAIAIPNITSNVTITGNYTIGQFQSSIQYFFIDWGGYILSMLCFAFAYAWSFKISQTLIAGGIGMVAIFFMFSNPVFFAGGLLSIVLGYVLKYVAG